MAVYYTQFVDWKPIRGQIERLEVVLWACSGAIVVAGLVINFWLH